MSAGTESKPQLWTMRVSASTAASWKRSTVSRTQFTSPVRAQ